MQVRTKRFNAVYTPELHEKLIRTFEYRAADMFARDGTDRKGINVRDYPELKEAIRKIFMGYVMLFYEAQTYDSASNPQQRRTEKQYNELLYKRYTGIAVGKIEALLEKKHLFRAPREENQAFSQDAKNLWASLIGRTCHTFNEVFPEIALNNPCIGSTEILRPQVFRELVEDSFRKVRSR